uniref:Uncharacterized protein n=1 Tax=Pipistrellus kuhlii TaxID=59472 RepID=A0A7J7SFN3_PIPKU|nr:hypothetical protein mPipKuh1_009979 [Pipistrellus kuhlii]
MRDSAQVPPGPLTAQVKTQGGERRPFDVGKTSTCALSVESGFLTAECIYWSYLKLEARCMKIPARMGLFFPWLLARLCSGWSRLFASPRTAFLPSHAAQRPGVSEVVWTAPGCSGPVYAN